MSTIPPHRRILARIRITHLRRNVNCFFGKVHDKFRNREKGSTSGESASFLDQSLSTFRRPATEEMGRENVMAPAGVWGPVCSMMARMMAALIALIVATVRRLKKQSELSN